MKMSPLRCARTVSRGVQATQRFVPRHPRVRRHSEYGLSLVEVLFAGLLVSVVAIFLAPLFVRSVASTRRGGESSQATNFTKTFLETSLAVPLNHSAIKLEDDGVPSAPGATVRTVIDVIYDTGPRDAQGKDVYAGDERWIVDDNDPDYDIRRRWDMTLEVRDYSYFDLIDGLVSAQDPNAVIRGGEPTLLDNPIPVNTTASHRHLKELRSIVTSRRTGMFQGSSERMTTRRVRSY